MREYVEQNLKPYFEYFCMFYQFFILDLIIYIFRVFTCSKLNQLSDNNYFSILLSTEQSLNHSLPVLNQINFFMAPRDSIDESPQ